ncbi:MAG TPA: right-handed parallel beta-helix repeat-containing protein [Bryobacteraceae bacterium]|jgi:parallel beta-helix repeat protein|nr:right-handed parallel beta-helix repeat-containing protein [Bryobacteraceae bacterium]
MSSEFTRRAVLRAAVMGLAYPALDAAAQSPSTSGTGQFTYYVDNAGSDSNNGLSPATAFQTISKVNTLQLLPGQSVGFKAGGVWRETLALNVSGTASNPITVASYDVASEPVQGAWTQGSGPILQDSPASAVFASGFEAADFGDWAGVAIEGGSPSISISTEHPAHGQSCMQFTGDGHANWASAYHNIAPMTIGSTYHFRLYLFTPLGSLAPNNGLKHIQFFGGSQQIGYGELYTDSTGKISSLTINMYSGGGYIQNLSLAGNYLMGAWNYLEIAYTVHASLGGFQAWVNGVLVGQTGLLNTSANAGLNQIRVGNGNYGSIVASGASIYFDDVKVGTSYIGPLPRGVPMTVWSTPQPSDPLSPTFNGQPGVRVYNLGSLVSAGQWYWNGSALYVYSATNPVGSVFIPARQYAVLRGSEQNTWRQGSGTGNSEDPSTAIFASGFEISNLSDWAGIGIAGSPTLGVTSVDPAHGESCLRFAGDGSDNRGNVYQYIPPMASDSTYYFRLYLRTPTGSLSPNNGLKYIQFFNGAKQLGYAELYTDNQGRISVLTVNMYGAGCVPNINVAPAYVMDAWNYLEIALNANSTSGSIQAWVNGSPVVNAQSLNTMAIAGLDQIQVGNGNYGPIVGKGASIYFDDVKVASTGPIGPYVSGIPTTVWYAPQTANPLYPSFDGLPGTQVNSIGAVSSQGQWFWDGSCTIYAYSVSNPADSVEIPARPYGVVLSAASNVVLSNLCLAGAQVSGLFASRGCNSVTLNSCVLECNWENGGFFLDGNHYQNYGTVQNCTLRNNGASGWNTNGYFTNWLFNNNVAYSNGQVLSGSIEHDFSAGIKIFSITGRDGAGTVFRNNLSYSNGPQSTYSGQGVGLWADTCTGVTFTQNTVHDNAAWGIYLEKNQNSTASFNLAYNNAKLPYCANLACKAGDGNSAANNKFVNNTCVGGWWGMYCGAYEGDGQSFMNGALWANNIAVGSSNQNFYIDVGGDNDAQNGSGNVYTHNCFGLPFTNFLYWASLGLLSTYTGFDAACGNSCLSIEGDPGFLNASSGDYQLSANSPCLGSGLVVLGITSAQPNVGAY